MLGFEQPQAPEDASSGNSRSQELSELPEKSRRARAETSFLMTHCHKRQVAGSLRRHEPPTLPLGFNVITNGHQHVSGALSSCFCFVKNMLQVLDAFLSAAKIWCTRWYVLHFVKSCRDPHVTQLRTVVHFLRASPLFLLFFSFSLTLTLQARP